MKTAHKHRVGQGLILSAGVLCVVAFVVVSTQTLGERPGAVQSVKAVAEAASMEDRVAPAGEVLFDDLDLPYDGIGKVSVTNDGILVIDVGGNIGEVWLPLNIDEGTLVERDGKSTLVKEVPDNAISYEFDDGPDPEWGTYSLVEVIGDLNLDYDEDSGILSVDVQGEGRAFHNEFLVEAAPEVTEEDLRFQAAGDCPAGYSCCSCAGENGGSASAQCRPGERAKCTCRPCCSSVCIRLREVQLIPYDYEGPVPRL